MKWAPSSNCLGKTANYKSRYDRDAPECDWAGGSRCALATPVIRVPAKKPDRDVTARRPSMSQEIGFGCYTTPPSCKE